jgi:aldehyde dehydrogenase (NAD+)
MSNVPIYSSYIDGEWEKDVKSFDLEIRDPGNLDKISSRYKLASTEDAQKAVDASKNAFEAWSDTPSSERASYVYEFIDLWKKNIDIIAKAATIEMGKPLKESRLEAERAVTEMRYWASEALRIGDRTFPSTRVQTEAYTIRQPIGPVVAITPWNFPILTPLRKVIPALVCGCPVILKPAAQAPGASVIIAQLMEKVGLPKGVFHLLIGSGRTVGNVIVQSKDIAGISFTGSTQVGLHIEQEAAKRNAKVQLEMGGKNAAVVVNYKNIDRAAKEIVSAAFTTSGQRCTAVSRVIVVESQKVELEESIIKYVKELNVGYGLDESTVMGPVSSEEQYKTVNKYLELVADGQGDILVEGKKPNINGFYIPPTVITNVKPGSTLAVEEIFGPVLVILAAKDFDEALKINNETSYGLTSAIFTDDMSFAHKFSIKSEAGMVHVNHGTSSEGHLPFGGVKMSGQGAFGIGDTSKDFFTTLKAIYRMTVE